MKLIRTKNYEELSRKAANIIAAQITLKPDCLLGLATGSSPIGTYDNLVSMYESGNLDFSRVRSVNLDEYMGLGGDNDQSYRYFMNKHLFERVNIDMTNTHVPDVLSWTAKKPVLPTMPFLRKWEPSICRFWESDRTDTLVSMSRMTILPQRPIVWI